MKKIIGIVVLVIVVLVFITGVFVITKPHDAVLLYYRIRNTPQKISVRDDLILGTITEVKGTHFTVKYTDGKIREYVTIGKTRFENGDNKNIIVGNKVGVIGSYDEDETYIAKIVRFGATSPRQFLNIPF